MCEVNVICLWKTYIPLNILSVFFLSSCYFFFFLILVCRNFIYLPPLSSDDWDMKLNSSFHFFPFVVLFLHQLCSYVYYYFPPVFFFFLIISTFITVTCTISVYSLLEGILFLDFLWTFDLLWRVLGMPFFLVVQAFTFCCLVCEYPIFN